MKLSERSMQIANLQPEIVLGRVEPGMPQDELGVAHAGPALEHVGYTGVSRGDPAEERYRGFAKAFRLRFP